MLNMIFSSLGRLYPLKSGCGQIANSSLFRWLDPQDGPDAIARVAGARAVVPAGDYVGRAMRYLGDIDPKVSWVVDQVVEPGDVALDIGSNLGVVSLRLAARAGKSGHVHAFEPQPRMQDYFNRTLTLNPGLEITLHPIGLGAEDSELVLHLDTQNAGRATLTEALGPSASSVSVPVRRLTQAAQDYGIDRIDFIKMDVEGFECQVLQGGSDLLRKTSPNVILLEENSPYQNGLAPSLQLLVDLGYTLYALPRRLFKVTLVPLTDKPEAHDFVAISGSCPNAIKERLGVL